MKEQLRLRVGNIDRWNQARTAVLVWVDCRYTEIEGRERNSTGTRQCMVWMPSAACRFNHNKTVVESTARNIIIEKETELAAKNGCKTCAIVVYG